MRNLSTAPVKEIYMGGRSGAVVKQTAAELVRLSLNVMLLGRPDCNITVDVNLWCS